MNFTPFNNGATSGNLVMSAVEDSLLRKRDEYTDALLAKPYDASIYLKRAECHEELQYHEFAVGDAYKALLLTDEVLDDAGEYHEQAVQAIQQAATDAHTSTSDGDTVGMSGQKGIGYGYRECRTGIEDKEDSDQWYNTIAKNQSRDAYRVLARSLTKCGDLKSAWDFAGRGCKAFPMDGILQDLWTQTLQVYTQRQPPKNPAWDTESLGAPTDLPQCGHARREIYPWNAYEPERYSSSTLSLLNYELSSIAHKCEVRTVELPFLFPDSSTANPASQSSQRIPNSTHKQLGLFATADISPYETIFCEPSILTANNHLYDTLCDACSSPLPTTSSPLPACPFCDDTVFCSASCLARAQKLYHPAICGHPDFDLSARDPSPAVATDALYLLLLARTIAMAETQNLHPLNLREIKYLWGDFNHPSSSSSSSTTTPRLPFSFQSNIQNPLHLLSNLNLNIFAQDTLQKYDFWIINTLLAKFRGVASAKMNPRTGIPEVCAVHWRWCLANHSCAPNVRWEWPVSSGIDRPDEEQREEGGCMTLVARGGKEVVQWGSQERGGGIKKDKEILSHYCDVDLPVEARREWAAGALGGVCVCERCVWEAARAGGGGLEEEEKEGKLG